MNKANKKNHIYLVFEFSEPDLCTLYINRNKTMFNSNPIFGSKSLFKDSDGDYARVSHIFGRFFNYHFKTERLLRRESVSWLDGHTGNKFSTGTDLSVHVNILKRLRGFNLEFIVETKTAKVFMLQYDSSMLKDNRDSDPYWCMTNRKDDDD